MHGQNHIKFMKNFFTVNEQRACFPMIFKPERRSSFYHEGNDILEDASIWYAIDFCFVSACSLVQASWNVMAHTQKPDLVFRRKGRVHLNRRGRQFSRLLAAEVCTSAVVMLDTPCSEAVWRVLATHYFRQFPFHFPSSASTCAIIFQLESNGRSIFVISLRGGGWLTEINYPKLLLLTLNEERVLIFKAQEKPSLYYVLKCAFNISVNACGLLCEQDSENSEDISSGIQQNDHFEHRAVRESSVVEEVNLRTWKI
jgi:hypothetical protein